jgi:DNA mismatch repair protein MutS
MPFFDDFYFFWKLFFIGEALMYDSLLFLNHQSQPQQQTLSKDSDDLLLFELINDITKSKERFDLKPFFYQLSSSIEEIEYRQQILNDIYDDDIRKLLNDFSVRIYDSIYRIEHVFSRIESHSEYFNNNIEKGKFLHAVVVYCDALINFYQNISETNVQSKGLSEFIYYIEEYIKSKTFLDLKLNADAIQKEMKNISFNMLITQGNIKVKNYEGQKEISEEIQELFLKFREAKDIKQYKDNQTIPHAEHVEVAVLDLLSTIHTETFSKLEKFCLDNIHYIDRMIHQVAREIQFFVCYYDYIAPLKEQFSFCFPKVTTSKINRYLNDSFDIVLAKKYIKDREDLVLNGFSIKENEKILIVTGPNQGGKTTFARMIGQVHYLSGLGLSVPGTSAQLLVVDHIYTHFEKEEDIENKSGKLKDDLIRLKDIIDNLSSESLVVINEILASTSLEDGLYIGEKIIDQLVQQDCTCVYVTFLDELSNYSPACVSLVSEVDDEDFNKKTLKIVRKDADGKAYAHHIARKFGLTKDRIEKRLACED